MIDLQTILPDIKNVLIQEYGIFIEHPSILGENENLVIRTKGKVIRITSENHRNQKELEAELEFIQELKSRGCAVPEVILTNNTAETYKLVDSVNGRIYLVVFVELKGVGNIHSEECETRSQVISEWGKTMGAIHKVTSKLQLKNAKYRKHWDKEIIIEKADELLSNEDGIILENLKQVLDIVNTFNKDSNVFGLTHTDMRPRNFAYADGIITHFDFDDICHHWFIYDIAVSAYHEIESITDLDGRTRFAINFLKDFTDGYMKERGLNRRDLLQILILMKLRCIYAYIDYYKRLKIKGVDSGKEKMLVRRGYVLNFNSFININSLEAYLFTTSHYE